MGFRINTNVAAMNSHVNATMTNRGLDSSLSKLSSGLRINSAADDASGMAIADSLRSQSSSLGQAIRNANDGMSIIQIADKAMDEQIKILDTIKVKATQSAQDGQSAESRAALQKDIVRLMESLDSIANTTSYNGQSLLSGAFTNKEFQIGAYSNQTVSTSINATTSQKIGSSRFETTDNIIVEGVATMVFSGAALGGGDITLESVVISSGANTGLGALVEVINKNTELTGVTAKATVVTTMSAAITAGSDVTALTINGISIGTFSAVAANDSEGELVNAINSRSLETGVTAAIDSEGRLELTSTDGRGIVVSSGGFNGVLTANYGRLTLMNQTGQDIVVSAGGTVLVSGAADGEQTLNLAAIRGEITSSQALAIGALANTATASNISGGYGVGVTTFEGAQATMNIADSARTLLDTVRADLGAVQNQLISTVNNISVTQVNVAAAESNIRDVDFAAESANFSRLNILAQSGSYAMSQANAVQQNVLRLLQ